MLKLGQFHAVQQINKLRYFDNKQHTVSTQVLTVASPDLSQVAATLARLFAELNDIAARCLRGDGHLSYSLFPIAEVHRQYHLKKE